MMKRTKALTLDELELEAFNQNENELDAYSRTLAKRYRQAYALLIKDVRKLYETLGDNITLEEARKFKRLDSLMASVAEEYKKLTSQTIGDTEQFLTNSYMNAHQSMQYALGELVPKYVAALVPINALRASVYSELYGQTAFDTLKKNSENIVNRIRAEITRAMVQGQGYGKTARGLADLFKQGAWQADRVVRTESHRAWSQGDIDSRAQAKAAGVELSTYWSATLDMRTRLDHAKADGQRMAADGTFTVGGEKMKGPGLGAIPSNVINCRCQTVDYLPGDEPTKRRARQIEDGKEIKGKSEVIDYKTYEEWAAPRGWTPDKGWPKPGKPK